MVKKKMKIIWDDEAKKSLWHIYFYIKSREPVEVACKVRDKIITQTKTLDGFPEKFEKEHNLDEEAGNYRYCVMWSYKIIYEFTEETIYILDIFHTSRDPLNIKKLK